MQLGQNELSQQMTGYMRLRQKFEAEHRFVDVPYRDIVGDVMASIERIHAAAGEPLTDAARAAMRHWEAENPPGKHGQHKYSLANLGLTAVAIRDGFAQYLDRFGSLCR